MSVDDKNSQVEEFKSKDLVYCGLRYSTKTKKLFVAIREIKDDQSLSEESLFDYKKNRDRAIGGIYRGAVFTSTKIRGLDANLQYIGRWHSQAEIIRWQADNDQAEVMHRSSKLEKDENKIREIERVMKPLRVLFDNYRKRNDFAGMDALEAAAIRALKTPIRKSE